MQVFDPVDCEPSNCATRGTNHNAFYNITFHANHLN